MVIAGSHAPAGASKSPVGLAGRWNGLTVQGNWLEACTAGNPFWEKTVLNARMLAAPIRQFEDERRA